MKIINRLKPKSNTSTIMYYLLNAFLPTVILGIFLVAEAYELTISVPVFLSITLLLIAKWRIFAVKPRYWLSNIRSNLVDIFVGLSVISFIAGTESIYTQVLWTILFTFWLSWLKPKSKQLPVMIQALVAQTLGLVAFFSAFPDHSLLMGMMAAWLVCYASARHFLGAFDEPLIKTISQICAWFGAIMAWILGHWVIEYMFLPQIALILTILGYGLASLYYLHSKEKLTSSLKIQLISVMSIILLIIIVFSDWQDKTI
jgi:hypothetical protein